MADERPVCDVLCDAMEYLCKLGANLRTRTESLKDRRIKREKLNNAHALQKAASKVLLICELSKKSLENVETGVKRILSIVDASQTLSDGAKSSKTNEDNKHKYQYFYVGPHKVKVSKKVPLKHFKSVKVLARSMPLSMQEKYPVYYNCKLYRLRKKSHRDSQELIQRISHKESESVDTEHNKSQHNTHETDEVCFLGEQLAPHLKDIDKHLELDPQLNSCSVTSCSNSKESVKLDEKQEEGTNDEHVQQNVSKSPNQKSDQILESNSYSKTVKKDFCVKENISELNSSHLTNVEENEELSDINNLEIAKDDVVSSKTKNDESGDSDHSVDSTSKKPLIKCVNISKLLKPDILENNLEIVPSQSGKNKENKKNINHSRSKMLEKLAKKRRKSDEYWEGKRKEVKAFIPKTFIIKVTRLPNFTDAFLLENKLQKITQSGSAISQLTLTSAVGDTPSSSVTNVKETNDKVYENKEPNEATDKSVINDGRTALLTDLDSNKAKDNQIITQSGSVNSQLASKSAKEDTPSSLATDLKDTNNKEKDCNETTDKSVINDVRTALLTNSDSDGPEVVKNSLSKKSKGALLTDSESDKAKDDQLKDQDDDSNKIKKSLLNESDSDHNVEPNKATSPVHKSNNEHMNAKNMLLNESDSEAKEKDDDMVNNSEGIKQMDVDKQHQPSNEKAELINDEDKEKSDGTPKTPNNKRKRQNSDTPKSKRKHIMESMHAKKMLLTYSSSSDTEDEQLRNALKEIRDSLKKGISSSDDENDMSIHSRKTPKRKIYTSSDSGEGGSKKEKGRRKNSTSGTEINKEESEKDTAKDTSSIDQIDGNMDDLSNSSNSKVRSLINN